MTFKVGLVDDIKTVSIAHFKEAGVIRVMACADGIDIVRLHYFDVALHMCVGGGVTEGRVAVVTVHAAKLYLLAVDVDNLADNLNLAKADGEGHILSARRKGQGVEIGVLVRPFFHIFQGGQQDADTVTLNTALALCDDLTVSVGQGQGRIKLCRCGKLNRQLATLAGKHRLYKNVGNSRLGAGKNIHIAENSRCTVHILVLEIGAVAPLHNKHLQVVLTFGEKWCDIKLGDHMADLTVTDKFVIYEEVEAGVHALENEDMLTRLAVKVEFAVVKTRGIFLGYIRRILREGVVDIRVLRGVIALADGVLPVHWHGERVAKLGQGG